MTAHFSLTLLPDVMAVCRLPADSSVPSWIDGKWLHASIRTNDELCIICSQDVVPDGERSEKEWRVFKVNGPLDFSQIGVLASLAEPLAAAKVSIFVLSTYNTDYLMVKKNNLSLALDVLRKRGHEIMEHPE